MEFDKYLASLLYVKPYKYVEQMSICHCFYYLSFLWFSQNIELYNLCTLANIKMVSFSKGNTLKCGHFISKSET